MILTKDSYINIYGHSQSAIDMLIHTHRKKFNSDPQWLINGEYINTDIMFKWDNIIQRCWVYNTDPDGVYYALKKFFKKDIDIARELALRSKQYKSEAAWVNFISKDLFSIRCSTAYEKEYHKQIDFFYIGVQILKENINGEKIDKKQYVA